MKMRKRNIFELSPAELFAMLRTTYPEVNWDKAEVVVRSSHNCNAYAMDDYVEDETLNPRDVQSTIITVTVQA